MTEGTWLPAARKAALHTITRWWFSLALLVSGVSFVFAPLDPVLPYVYVILFGLMAGRFWRRLQIELGRIQRKRHR